MTNWIYNLIQNMMWVAALPEAFRLGETYGRAIEYHFREENETEPEYEVYKSWTQEQRDSHEKSREEAWKELNAEVWNSGCGRPQKLAHCVTCGFGYNASWGSPKQGSGCCAWSFFEKGKWWVVGGYGSSVADMYYYELIPTSEGKAGELSAKVTQGDGVDPICDGCLLIMINSGVLVERGSTGPECRIP